MIELDLPIAERRAAQHCPQLLGRAVDVADTAQAVTPLASIEAQDVARTPSGIEELDRVLGGGVVEGGVVLIGGDPGIGKSTLLLQAMDALQRAGLPTLYVTGEESGAQVALRSRRGFWATCSSSHCRQSARTS